MTCYVILYYVMLRLHPGRKHHSAASALAIPDSAHQDRSSPVDITTYGQSPYSDSGFQMVGLKQNLDRKGWNSRVHG